MGVQTIAKTPERDLAFGEGQLKAMLRDRPKMNGFFKPESKTWHWLVLQFAGDATGAKVFWRNTNHTKTFFASYTQKQAGSKEYWISVNEVDKDGYVVGRESMWSSLIGVFLQLKNSNLQKQLVSDAIGGKIDKEEFVRNIVSAEFDNSKRICKLFKEFLLPDAVTQQIKLHEIYWCAKLPPTKEEYFRTDQALPSRKHYEAYFDEEIKPRVEAVQSKFNSPKLQPPVFPLSNGYGAEKGGGFPAGDYLDGHGKPLRP